jgi:serine/threonine-protein kinase RsbW
LPLVKKIVFDLHSTRDSINRVTDLVAGAFNELGLNEDAIFDIKLAIQEAVVNAVEHGNGSDPRKMIHVSCDANDDSVILVVRDEGDGFDLNSVPDPTLPENILREHGRGIFLMKSLCDEVRYNPLGNEVTIAKRFHRRDI